MAQAPNAILAINSLDRYIAPQQVAGIGSITSALYNEYIQEPPFSNDFTIESGGALIYGYMRRLVVSQVQFECNIPTVCADRNDTFPIYRQSTADYFQITIPFGFYTPNEMAATLQVLIRQTDMGISSPTFSVAYDNTNGASGGFVFLSNNSALFSFPSIEQLASDNIITYDNEFLINIILRTYKMLGITISNVQPQVNQYSSARLKWLYTSYVDIISSKLTKYQNIKDTDTSAKKQDSIVARIYLTGVGVAQPLTGDDTVGSRPFTVVQDMNSPKVIRWSTDEAVNSLDFQVRDQYGNLIFIAATDFEVVSYSSEFQMTLLCVESERY